MLKKIWMSAIIGTIMMVMAQNVLADEQVIYVGKEAPYVEGSIIARAVLDECNLPAKQIEYIEQAAKDDGTFKIVKNDEAVKAGKDRVLLVEIVNAVSGGNTFMGHHKQVIIKGRLLENGVVIGSFSGIRQSTGGAFAGFKSSCVVLERCSETLGKDLIKWLKKPAMNSRIGE